MKAAVLSRGRRGGTYAIRTCRLYPHECAVCGGNINLGQKYYDGGYGKRSHVGCADAWEQAHEIHEKAERR